MSTRYEQLITQVVTNIMADLSVDETKVYRNRQSALNDTELPGYNVVLGPDAPLDELGPSNVAWLDSEIVLFVDCYARSILSSDGLSLGATGVNMDELFLNMRRNIHRSLMADHTQGLPFVMTTIPLGGEEPTIDDEGERKNIVYRTNWGFRVRNLIDDLAPNNLIFAPRDLSNAYWQNSLGVITPNADIGPDGANLADKVTDDGSMVSNSVQFRQDVRGIKPGTIYTYAESFKPDQRDWVKMMIQSANLSPTPSIFYNVNTGVVGTVAGPVGVSGAIAAEANGYYRCSLQFVSDAVAPDINIRPAFRVAEGDNDDLYVLDGTFSVFADHAQLSEGTSTVFTDY